MRAGKIQFFLFLVLIVCAADLSAQTLFTYGNHAVTKAEFLKAYNKNSHETKSSENSYRNYLELYTRYKLKVQAAHDAKLDSLPSQTAELTNFRNQVMENYMKDDESLNRMAHEAFLHAQKDIHLGHIFVALGENPSPADSARAWDKIMLAWNTLNKGGTFENVAALYSEDPAARTNHGDIGFISVFTLSYELENAAYQLQTGKYSKPIRSKNGIHILENKGERKALGKIRLAHILLAFPPNGTTAVQEALKKRIDSIHAAALSGSSFAELAKAFSDDNLSYQTGGEIPVFGVGRYESAFENAAFALSKNGEISEPVLTSFGYHLLRRIGRIAPPATENKENLDLLKQEILTGPRAEITRKDLLQKIFRLTKFKKMPVDEQALWTYTDSAVLKRPIPKQSPITEQTVLFSFPKKNVTVKDWLGYIGPIMQNPSLVVNRPHAALMDQYIQAISYDYYREHLEEYNPEFAFQLAEFKDGNLLFEIMQRNVWDKAGSDSTGLQNYYTAHKEKYWWNPSADAVLFTCNSTRMAESLKKVIAKDVHGWKVFVDSSNGSVQADSGRFELAQLPVAENGHYSEGAFSSYVSNQTDNAVTFAYILKMHDGREPRSYKDARGFVINDYQTWLEENWIKELKKKYPVKINEAVFKELK